MLHAYKTESYVHRVMHSTMRKPHTVKRPTLTERDGEQWLIHLIRTPVVQTSSHALGIETSSRDL